MQPRFDRGFTGHEHLAIFGLINMNGRMYDPMLGLFLSPDPYVQAPDFTQNFNRYSYCLNNPLMYTDPSGEFWHLVIGAVIGGVANWIAHGAEFSWEGLAYFGVGALAGALGAGVGAGVCSALVQGGSGFLAGAIGTATHMSTGFAAGFVSGAAGGFASGFTTGFGNAWVAGDNLSVMFNKGIDYGWKGAVMGGIAGGIGGGIDAVRNDRNFWTGDSKQNMVVQINNEGYKVSPKANMNNRPSNEDVEKLYSTTIQENHAITINSSGDITFRGPDGIKGLTVDALGKPIVNTTVNGNIVTISPLNLNQVDRVIISGWRYHHSPFTLSDLFGSGRSDLFGSGRQITKFINWFP